MADGRANANRDAVVALTRLHGRRHGARVIWDFDEEVRRIRPVAPGLPIPEAQFTALIEAARRLDTLERADRLVQLTLKGA